MHVETLAREPVVTTARISDEWLAGFCDGESNLGIAEHDGQLQPRFRLNQRDDDGDLVREIHAYLGVGSLSPKIDRKNPNANPQLALVVAGRDCERLVRLFDEHPLRSKKRFEFPYWRSAVCLAVRFPGNRWLPPQMMIERNEKLAYLKEAIEKARAYGGPR